MIDFLVHLSPNVMLGRIRPLVIVYIVIKVTLRYHIRFRLGGFKILVTGYICLTIKLWIIAADWITPHGARFRSRLTMIWDGPLTVFQVF